MIKSYPYSIASWNVLTTSELVAAELANVVLFEIRPGFKQYKALNKIYGHYHSHHHESPALALRLLSESQQECYRSRGPLGVDWIRMSPNCKLRMKAECFLLLLDLVVVVNQQQPSAATIWERRRRRRDRMQNARGMRPDQALRL